MTPHGSVSTYVNYKCRCTACRDANAAYHRAVRAARMAQLRGKPRRDKGHGPLPKDTSAVVHGRYSTYINWGCRCRPCTGAWATYQRTRKARA